MKNLYSLTPKHLASIQKTTRPAQPPPPPEDEPEIPPQPQSQPRPQRAARGPEPKIQYDSASPAPQPESWWSAVLGEEGSAPAGNQRESALQASERPSPQYDWSAARELFEADGIADLTVTGVNRGGLLVEGERIRGFIPLSHLIGVPSLNTDEERQAAMYRRVGQPVRAKIIEFDPEKGRVVFSERAAQAAPGRRAELLAQMQVGDRTQGEVTNITNFGVFIDLGGMEGLVHLSEISWGRVHNPADFVKIGQKVDVVVISVDRDQGRIALSIKRLLPDPWVTVPQRYVPGMWVPCTITHVTTFGAFASLEEGVEGLIHISELSDGPFMRPQDVVTEGEEVTARVLSVITSSRRLALSLRHPETYTQQSPAAEEFAAEEPPESMEVDPDEPAESGTGE